MNATSRGMAAVVCLALGMAVAAEAEAPRLAELAGAITRVRVDLITQRMEDRRQFFIDKPDEVAEVLRALGTGRRVRRPVLPGDMGSPDIVLVLFDASHPRVQISFQGRIGKKNRVFTFGALEAHDHGGIVPVDAAAIERLIARHR